MKNSVFKLIFCALLAFLPAIDLQSQTCCNSDTIYFDNQVDCPLCIEVECYDPNTGLTTPILGVQIINNLPLSAWPSVCPDPSCGPFTSGYIGCGGPPSPQLGKILIPSTYCNNCQYLKFKLTKVAWTAITPVSVYSSNGPNMATINQSNCCHQFTPNLEMVFDCNTSTLSFKCIP
jgi:hypothetical protein